MKYNIVVTNAQLFTMKSLVRHMSLVLLSECWNHLGESRMLITATYNIQTAALFGDNVRHCAEGSLNQISGRERRRKSHSLIFQLRILFLNLIIQPHELTCHY